MTDITQTRNRAIETLREGGLTYEEIGKIIGLSIGRVGTILHDKEFKEHRKRYRQGEAYQTWARNYRRQNQLCVGGKVLTVRKRQRPDDICETCGGVASKLFYHHWDDNNLSNGVWVCYHCHKIVEAVDKINFDVVKAQYLKLKHSILVGGNHG